VTTDPNHPPNLPGMDHVGEHFEEGEEAPPHGAHAMAIVRWALIGLMALAAVASVVYYFGGFHFSSAGESGTQYYCPMHPSIVQGPSGGVPHLQHDPGGARGWEGEEPVTSRHAQGVDGGRSG